MVIEVISLLFYLTEMVYNALTIKSYAGRKLKTFEEILTHYFQTNLLVDLLNIIILVVDVSSTWTFMNYARLFILTKLPQCLDKIEKLEVLFIKNYYNEQYWSLIKVVLFNFCFAHTLAIFLSAMANLNPQENWHRQVNITNG